MLPKSNFKDMFYPMTADIYYSENKQDALGVIQKSWVYDRTVKCSIISTMSTGQNLTTEIKNGSSNFVNFFNGKCFNFCNFPSFVVI